MSPSPSAQKRHDYRKDPLLFVREQFKIEPDEWQKDALALVGGSDYRPRRRVGMKACTGPGKSTVLAWIAWHRLMCFVDHGEHPKGAAVSGEGLDNLMDNLWAEIAKWQQRSEFLMTAFAMNQEHVYAKDHPKTWFLSARSYARDADPEAIGRALSGLHSKFPFILLDEIGDMPITVGQKAEQIFTGLPADALIAGAGNPTSTSGLLKYISSVVRELWEIITITADPQDPKRTPRVAVDLAEEQIRLHGRDNPWVMATILGEFPPGGLNTLLGLEQVERAMGKRYEHEDYSHVQKRIGIDVARFGDDRTVIFPRQGLVAFRPIEMRNLDGPQIAARAALAKAKWKWERCFVDDTGGYGASVIDQLKLGRHEPTAVNFSEKADDRRFFNKRAEIWFRMAEWVKAGGCLPRIPSLVRELTEPQYSYKQGRILIEEKDQIKKRLQFSPDMADALALTFTIADMPASDPIEDLLRPLQKENVKALCEWDPFAEANPA